MMFGFLSGFLAGGLVVIFYFAKETLFCKLAYWQLAKMGYTIFDPYSRCEEVKTREFGYVKDESAFEETLKKRQSHNQK